MVSAVQRLVQDMRQRDLRLANPELLGADFRQLRTFNRILVLSCIRQQSVARVEIARQTGLSRTTVSSIMDELLQEGLAQEGAVLSAAPTGGRRATLVRFNADAGICLGVDIGRTHLTMVAANLSGTILAHQAGPFEMDLGPQICLPEVVQRLKHFLAHHHLSWAEVIGVGVGLPGTIDVATHVLVHPPHLPGWDGINVRQALIEALDLPIYIDNDANMGALGESRYGAGRKIAHFAYIKVATGIGSGLIVNNRVYRGSSGFAGELGHISFGESGPACDCGNMGCLESVAGAEAIVSDAQRRPSTKGAIEPRRHLDIANVIQAAQEGDVASQRAIGRAAVRIGTAIAALINLLNPEAIILDGGVARAGDMLLEPLTKTVASRSIAAAWSRTRLLKGELEQLAIATGAVATVIDAAFTLPSLAMEQPSIAQGAL
jgi:predicted NBD/HSP70 family sugar kinase